MEEVSFDLGWKRLPELLWHRESLSWPGHLGAYEAGFLIPAEIGWTLNRYYRLSRYLIEALPPPQDRGLPLVGPVSIINPDLIKILAFKIVEIITIKIGLALQTVGDRARTVVSKGCEKYDKAVGLA